MEKPSKRRKRVLFAVVVLVIVILSLRGIIYDCDKGFRPQDVTIATPPDDVEVLSVQEVLKQKKAELERAFSSLEDLKKVIKEKYMMVNAAEEAETEAIKART